MSGNAPTVSAPSAILESEGEHISFVVSADDLDDDPIVSLVADLSLLPSGGDATFIASSDNTQGTFAWTPTFTDAGAYTVDFTATSNGMSGTAASLLQIEDVAPGYSLEAASSTTLTQLPIPTALRPHAADGTSATLSGTTVAHAAQTKTWLMYGDACFQRALGTWTPKSFPVADSLNSYPTNTLGGYGRADRTAVGSMGQVIHSSTPSTQRPPILAGSYSLWCGAYDNSWTDEVGYPNNAYSVIYIDTGQHSANYNLLLRMNLAVEPDYDFVYLLGGGSGAQDPLGNTKPLYDELLANPAVGNARRLVTWTGSIKGNTPGASQINTTVANDLQIHGDASTASEALNCLITIGAQHRALYLLLVSDDIFSSEDGVWPFCQGLVIDNLATSDHTSDNNGLLYQEGAAPGTFDQFGGAILAQTPQGRIISSRPLAGTGNYWIIVDGLFASTSDLCSPQKNSASDHMFFGAEGSSKRVVPGVFQSLITCSFPLASGTGGVTAKWSAYLNLPIGEGYVQWTEYRVYRSNAWSIWRNTRASGAVLYGVENRWINDSDDLPLAVGADSVQVRFNLQCKPELTESEVCGTPLYGVLYDDFVLEVVSGIPAPIFGIFPSALPQSTFVDGTMLSRVACPPPGCGPPTCTSTPCWPGVRGSAAQFGPITDNVNSPIGDSVVVAIVASARANGMGVNWRKGFSPQLGLMVDNIAFQPGLGAPRMIYRLFDPLTKLWSPFDSTELDADAVFIFGPDTLVLNSQFRMNWPPRDKTGLTLPSGFTINGVAAYNNLRFLPRGVRLQYYFKGVDIAGKVTYQFQSDQAGHEVEDLPMLPGGSVRAPDIIEFDVLPRFYPVGHVATLLASKVDTPILYLDGTYSAWEYGTDPTIEAMRGLGVRADRYRLLQGLGFGAGIGGREVSGQNPRHERNYFPNGSDYGIADSLAKWYQIIIESSHLRSAVPIDEADAALLWDWWYQPTPGVNANGGDRCILISGNDVFRSLANTPVGEPSTYRSHLKEDVFGVAGVIDSWNGTGSITYPSIDDRFANQLSGPALVTGFSYPIDGSCPTPDRFDALVPVSGTPVSPVAYYPLFGGQTNIAAVSRMLETDVFPDFDRGKALGYGFSLGSVRLANVPTQSPSYPHTGVAERMRVVYKFLTSCRGQRSSAPGDTFRCWPCPTDSVMHSNWAASSAFKISQYGPLYAIQDNQMATAVNLEGPGAPSQRSHLDGNFPNPFNPITTIRFSSATAGMTTLRIFNVGGQLLHTIAVLAVPGKNEIRWDGRNRHGSQLASGVYFYRIRFADGPESTSRMILLK